MLFVNTHFTEASRCDEATLSSPAHAGFFVVGKSLAEFRMKTSSEETWMKAANKGFSIPKAASPMPRQSTKSAAEVEPDDAAAAPGYGQRLHEFG
jgi:hypothetical protein